MAKNTKKGRRRIKGFHRRFSDEDFAWLAEDFQKQTQLNPGLTLEEFATGHGIQPEWIRGFIDLDDQIVTVWHGTTMDRAEAIKQEGFRAPSGKIWFTRRAREARQIAGSRAGSHGSSPAVLRCEISLGQYPNFERPKPDWYVFIYSWINNDVIRRVIGVKDGKPTDTQSPETAKPKEELVDVTVTPASGRLGVHWWLNRYLELSGHEPLDEDHPAVEAIYHWAETQYTEGGTDAIPEAAMLAQVKVHLSSQEMCV